MSSFMDEVVRPYVIWMLWPRTDARSIVEPEPPMTAAKIQMIETSKSPIDEIYEHLVENMEGDLNIGPRARLIGLANVGSKPAPVMDYDELRYG